MKNGKIYILALCSVCALTACGRMSTPSMMNTSRVQLVPETNLIHTPVANVTTGFLSNVAQNYDRYGADAVQMTVSYDPKSKTYGAVQAFSDLSKFKKTLTKMGVRQIEADTVPSEGSEPTFMLSYDAVSAAAPAGCRNMPGMDDGLTTAEIGEYRFGCSTESMLAKQIYRPSDLGGKEGADAIDGRRAANVVEYDRVITTDEADGELESFDRNDIAQ